MLVALAVSAARPGGPAAAARRPEILRLATAYELYGGLRRRLGGLIPEYKVGAADLPRRPSWFRGCLLLREGSG